MSIPPNQEGKQRYSYLLSRPQWQKKRLEIMERDNFACKFCLDSNSMLHVHHDYYERGTLPWEYPNESLYTLCEACHELVHHDGGDKAFLKETLVSRYSHGTLTMEAVDYLFECHRLGAL